MTTEIKKEQLSLKNLYRLLMEDDYPVYSQSVISEKNRKGVTLLRFWKENILYELCTMKYGRMIWRREGGRNRHLSEVCNRRIPLPMSEAYTGELLEILTPELTLHVLSGDAMNGALMKQIRSSGVLDDDRLWKRYLEKKTSNPVESRFLTRERGELFHSPLSSRHFFGREEELFELQEKCRRGGYYLLSGIGGIGKTELLRQLLGICVKDTLAEEIVVIQYEVSLADSFATAFPEMKGMEPENALMEIFIKLRQKKEKKLLVLIDNVNRSCEEDPDLKQLLTIPGTVFVTSRLSELEGFETVHVQVPSRTSCKLIFRDNYDNYVSPEENRYLDQLLEKEVWCHTLTLRLLGRAASVQGWTVSQLLERLEKGGSRISWKEESKNIRLKQVYRYMYSVANMTSEEKGILRLQAVFPYKGYKAAVLCAYRNGEAQDAGTENGGSLEETEKIMEKLWKGGWLEYDKKQGYSMHPFIAECLRSMKALKAPEFLELLHNKEYRRWKELDYNAWSKSIVRPYAKDADLADILLTASSYLEGAVDGEVMRNLLMAQEIAWRTYGVSRESWKQMEGLMNRCREVTDELRVRFYLSRARVQWPDMEYNEAEFRRQSAERTISEALYLDFCCAYGMNLTMIGQVDRSDEILKMVLTAESTWEQKINSCYYLAANENMRMNIEGMLEWSERGLKIIEELPEEEKPGRMQQGLLGMKCSACILLGQYEPAQECLTQMGLQLSRYDCFEFRYTYYNEVSSYAFQYAGSQNGGLDCVSANSVFNTGGFSFPESVKTLHFGENVYTLATFCDYIAYSEEVTIAEENPYFCVVDGVVFSKDKTILHFYPRLKTDTSYSVPDGVVEIAKRAFYYNAYIQEMSMPDSVLAIREKAIAFTTSLEKLTLSNQLQTIESTVFSGCTSLKELVIPASVTVVGNYAFSEMTQEPNIKVYFMGNCPTFALMVFSSSSAQVYYMEGTTGWTDTVIDKLKTTGNASKYVVTVEAYAPVSGTCGTNLTWTLDPSGTLRISGTGAMTDFELYGPWFEEYSSQIKSVIIEDGVTCIGANAFSECANLTSVTIADTVTSIGAYAFYACTSLKKINIPNSVISIGEGAFRESGLTSVTIPASVTEIGDRAFQSTSLTEVVFEGNYPEIGTYAFASLNTESVTFIFPEDDTTWSEVDSIEDLGGLDSTNNTTMGDVVIDSHVHQYETVTQAATCTEEGSKTEICTICGKSTTTAIAATGHSWNSGTVTKAAACSTTGIRTYTCTACGGTKTSTIAATGHSWNSGTVTKAAACTTTGTRTYTCNTCGGTKTSTISATGHSASSTWTTTKAATCTSAGTMVQKCTKCSTAVNSKSIAATGHSWGAWTETKAATVFESKWVKRTCSKCGATAEACSGKPLTPTIELNAYNIPLKVGQSTTKVKVSGLANGDYVKSWKSSNTSIVKVNATSGKITAQKKKGTAKVTVTLASGKTATVTVTVQKTAVKSKFITIVGSTTHTLAKGKTLNLVKTMQPTVYPITSTQKLTYTSSNKKVATVSSSGVVTAKGAGTTKITIKSGSAKEVITIKVPKTKTTALSGVPASLTISKGKTYTLKVKVKPSNSDQAVTYKTSNKKIASITSKGKIKGVKKGTATITVTSGSIKKSFKVTVK